MQLPLWGAAALAATLSSPDSDTAARLPDPVLDTDGIVGGHKVRKGDWRDVALITMEDGAHCSGTLISPGLVVTAGHCVRESVPIDVLIGSTDRNGPEGEHIGVDHTAEYPDSEYTYDVGLVYLAHDSHWEPRAIGVGCVSDEIRTDAKVESVGWGATNTDGVGLSDVLNEIRITVTDPYCEDNALCREPGGELMAGGNGRGPCPGDSGSPLYLSTDQGDFLVGIESRSDTSKARCGYGSIWTRTDAVIGWIENHAHRAPLLYPSCNWPPRPSADPIETRRNHPATGYISVVDVDGSPALATITVARSPENGSVRVLADHEVEYSPDHGYVGADAFTLTITDNGTGNARTGAPVSADLDVDVTVSGCGCASTSASSSGPPGSALVIGLLAGIRRRYPCERRRETRRE